ncbi:MAG TPA: TlpA disulfide reductase family protein [Steroidobacteraceae bacterium]|jgi:thiol-disulfide isomerase/thioredoxin
MSAMGSSIRGKTAAVVLSVAVAMSFHAQLQGKTLEGREQLVGRWDAQAVNEKGQSIPFRLDIVDTAGTLKGYFYDNLEASAAAVKAEVVNGQPSLTISNQKERLLGEIYRSIDAKLINDELNGTLSLSYRDDALRSLTGKTVKGGDYKFSAVHHEAGADANVPNIDGEWEVPLNAPNTKGERSQRLLVQQKGPDIAVSVLRVDGDGGAFDGYYHDGKWIVSSVNSRGLAFYEIKPQADTLLVKTSTGRTVDTHSVASDYSGEGEASDTAIAYRPAVARQKGLAEPADYAAHTTVRDSNEVFKFNFPDAATGKAVSSEDPRFKGKVVIAVVTGTWCPNCHDEVQYLVKLDEKYRDKGVAIVALDFEEPEQLTTLSRQKRFMEHYQVKYPYLIAGTPAEMWEKVPQLVNLNTWPTTVFVGRDGKVRRIHAGFASPASAKYYEKLQDEFTSTIDQLLAEPASTTASSADAPSQPDAAHAALVAEASK